MFFTQAVNEIEPTFLQDFLIILLSTNIKQTEKVTILQRILKESVQVAQKGASGATIKLAS